jgi:hypothetical protein
MPACNQRKIIADQQAAMIFVQKIAHQDKGNLSESCNPAFRYNTKCRNLFSYM